MSGCIGYLLTGPCNSRAYQKIYANEGTWQRLWRQNNRRYIQRIDLIDALKDESYQPISINAVTNIPEKKNGKIKWPLGIPVLTDKLIQEVLRMIMEAIYEGDFEPTSHVFSSQKVVIPHWWRYKRYSQGKTVCRGRQKRFFWITSTTIKADCKFPKETLNDDRFLRLIRKFLNAGYW